MIAQLENQFSSEQKLLNIQQYEKILLKILEKLVIIGI